MAVEDTTLQERLDDVGGSLTSGDPDRTGNLYTRDGRRLPPESDFVTGGNAVADCWQGILDAGVETIDIESLEVEVNRDTAMRVGLATLTDSEGEGIDEVEFIGIRNEEEG